MGTEVTKFDAELAARAAAKVADLPTSGGHFISLKGGIMAFDDTPLPGNQACVIILDSVRENTFYADKYVEGGDPVPPRCYAFAHGKDEMAPHPSMQSDLEWFKPQAADCASCVHNRFGSSDTGRGKACQNRFRLALLPAGIYTPKPRSNDCDLEFFTDIKHYETADYAFLKLPVMSGKNWTTFVKSTSNVYHRPPEAVLARLFVTQDKKAQYMVNFEVLDLLPEQLIEVVMRRSDEAAANIIQGYSSPEA